MAEDNEEKKELDPLITQPHGVEQQAKMEIVNMIHSGESPFDIIYHMAKRLEKSSGEPGYAQYVEDQIRAVYGFALEHVKPMQDELRDVEERLERIKKSYENPEFTEEEHIRIGFAIERHKKNIERLKIMIQKAEADHADMNITKTLKKPLLTKEQRLLLSSFFQWQLFYPALPDALLPSAYAAGWTGSAPSPHSSNRTAPAAPPQNHF